MLDVAELLPINKSKMILLLTVNGHYRQTLKLVGEIEKKSVCGERTRRGWMNNG